MGRGVFAAGLLALCALVSRPSVALTIQATTSRTALAQALMPASSGLVVRYVELDANTKSGAVSSGTFTNASGTYGVGAGVVISTGDVRDYADGPNTSDDTFTSYLEEASSPQAALAELVTGKKKLEYWDVTELVIGFDVAPSFNSVAFDLVFGSEEWPEFAASKYNDGFGLFLDEENIAVVGGLAVNVAHPDIVALPGTELDGVLAPGGVPRLRFDVPLPPAVGYSSGDDDDDAIHAQHELRLLIFDTSDALLDSTAFVSSLQATHMPEPSSGLLLGAGLAGLAAAQRRRALARGRRGGMATRRSSR